MKNKVKNLNNNKSRYLLIGIAILFTLVFLSYQYTQSRSQYSLLHDVDFTPRDIREWRGPKTGVSSNWKYIKVENVDGEEFIEHIQITSQPDFEYKVYTGAPDEIIKNIFEPERRKLKEKKEEYDLNEEEIDRFVDQRLDLEFPPNGVVIERIGEPFQQNTDYTITLTYKKWNLFNELFNKSKKVTYQLYFNDEQSSQGEMIRENFLFAQASYINFSSEYVTKYNNEREESCKISFANSIHQKLNVFTFKTNSYEVTSVDCLYPEENREIASVTILTQDIEEGKKAFEEELERLGIEQGKNLEIEYTHEPL
jgi:hypothetical protein